jgi:hypothetical protein
MNHTTHSTMTALFLLAAALAGASGCAAGKELQMSLGEAADGPSREEHPWGRVECGHGQVCSEVKVARVDVHRQEPGGPVEITLENRALDDVALQVQLEVLDKDGHRMDRSGFHDVAIAARQQSVVTLWQELNDGDRLVIRLRERA